MENNWGDNIPKELQGFFHTNDKSEEDGLYHSRIMQIAPCDESTKEILKLAGDERADSNLYTVFVHNIVCVNGGSVCRTLSKEQLLEDYDFHPKDLPTIEGL